MPPLPPLLRELILASQTARDPAVSAPMREAGFPYSGICGVWGFARVNAGPTFYEPDPDGQWALINGVYHEQGGLIDLVATSFRTSAMRLRRGQGELLGTAHLERAQIDGGRLIVYRDAVTWMHHKGRGIVVLDWKSMPPKLMGLSDGLVCQTDALARRLKSAFRRVCQPPLFVPSRKTEGTSP